MGYCQAMRGKGCVLVALCIALAACVVETRAAVVAQVRQDWSCPEEKTQVTEVSYGTYRLDGCGESKVYQCNFALQIPRCWPH